MANAKVGGWSKPPPQKALEGLYGHTRRAVIGQIKMTSSILVYNGNDFLKRDIEAMETDKYLSLTSETNNSSNFTVNFWPYVTLGDDWEVALVQAYIPHQGHQRLQGVFSQQ